MDKVVITANNQFELDRELNNSLNATEVHITLSCNEDYNFIILEKLKLIRILSIEFPLWGEAGEVIGDCGHFKNPLDFSFVQGLECLEYLIVDWNGEVINEYKIKSLSNLKYARLPISAFNPTLFENNSRLRQIEFGDAEQFVFFRKAKKHKSQLIKLTPNGYYNQFVKSNRTFKRFQKEKHIKEIGLWPTSLLLKNENQDTLIYYIALDKSKYNWILSDSSQTIEQIGRSDSDTILERRLNTEILSSEFKIFGTTTFRLKRNFKSRDVYSEFGYKNGLLDGLYLTLCDKKVKSKKMYNNGVLEFEFPYEDSVPILPDYYYLEHFSIIKKEAFFNEQGLCLLKANGQYPDESALGSIEIPINDMKIHGKLVVIDKVLDTILNVSYKNGVLDGPYFYYSKSYKDSAKVYCEYNEGSIIGSRKTVRNYTTTITTNNKERNLRTYTFRNSDSQMIEEKVWLPDKKQYLYTSWSSDGKIAIKQSLDENCNIIWEKYF